MACTILPTASTKTKATGETFCFSTHQQDQTSVKGSLDIRPWIHVTTETVVAKAVKDSCRVLYGQSVSVVSYSERLAYSNSA